jgi:hypothetical protein
MHRPFAVPAHLDNVVVLVAHSEQQVSGSVGAFATRSPAPFGLRVSGGAWGMGPKDKLKMLEYFVEGLRDFKGLVSSGATRDVTEGGLIDPMVTDVPAALLSKYGEERILTLSTLPRTGELRLVDDSRLIMVDAINDTYYPQPGVHMIIVFQTEDTFEVLGWDGDLDGYFGLFNRQREYGWNWGMPIWNGGGTTLKEMVRAATYGWPVFVVNNTGRRANDVANYVLKGVPIPDTDIVISEAARSRFFIVDRDDPGTLRAALRKTGLIAT